MKSADTGAVRAVEKRGNSSLHKEEGVFLMKLQEGNTKWRLKRLRFLAQAL